MITELTGQIKFSDARSAFIVIEAHGVGYEVFVSAVTRAALPFPNSPDVVTLKVKTVASENSLTLFGFATQAEYAAFLLFTRVPRVGPKVAQSFFSPAHTAFDAIVKGESEKLLSVNGVGKVTVKRIMHELHDQSAVFLASLYAEESLTKAIRPAVVSPGEWKAKHPAENARLEDLFRKRHSGGPAPVPAPVPVPSPFASEIDEAEKALDEGNI